MGKLVKIVLVIALIILVIILVTIGLPAWKYHEKIKPVINVNPTHFITVSGHLDPGLYLKIGVDYSTDHNICFHYDDFGQGLIEAEFHDLVYTPTIDNNNDYTITIPIDGLQPGYCHWGIGSVFYRISNSSHFHDAAENVLLHFYDKAKPIKDPIMLMSCGIKRNGKVLSCDFKDGNVDFLNLYFYTAAIKINFTKEVYNV